MTATTEQKKLLRNHKTHGGSAVQFMGLFKINNRLAGNPVFKAYQADGQIPNDVSTIPEYLASLSNQQIDAASNVDRAGRPMFDEEGNKLSIEQREDNSLEKENYELRKKLSTAEKLLEAMLIVIRQ